MHSPDRPKAHPTGQQQQPPPQVRHPDQTTHQTAGPAATPGSRAPLVSLRQPGGHCRHPRFQKYRRPRPRPPHPPMSPHHRRRHRKAWQAPLFQRQNCRGTQHRLRRRPRQCRWALAEASAAYPVPPPRWSASERPSRQSWQFEHQLRAVAQSDPPQAAEARRSLQEHRSPQPAAVGAVRSAGRDGKCSSSARAHWPAQQALTSSSCSCRPLGHL
mmetsp:Transcript_71806/g.206101  ORF Transcript_71806/g.206101 Transcript_71806/m.206101 type:complete len:215 (-) Transcript_71806:11-655(-)